MSKALRSNLSPCPFGCESKLEIYFSSRAAQRFEPPHFVTCLRCGCRGPMDETEKGAAARWNQRAAAPPSAPPR